MDHHTVKATHPRVDGPHKLYLMGFHFLKKWGGGGPENWVTMEGEVGLGEVVGRMNMTKMHCRKFSKN